MLFRGSVPPPKLSLMIQGRNVTEIYGGSVVEAHVGGGTKSDYAVQVRCNTITFNYRNVSRRGLPFQGRLVEVAEELFEDGYVRVQCLAHYDDYLFDKKELALAREEPQHSRRQLTPGYSGYPAAASRRVDEG